MSDEDTEVTETTEVTESAPPTTDPREASARVQGYVPKDEWKGDPEKWRDLDSFLAVGDKISAVQKERNERLTSEVLELKKTMKALVDDQRAQRDKAVAKALSELKAQKAEAISLGDGNRVNEIDDQIDATKAAAKVEEKKATDENPDFPTWHKENPWYLKDKVLTAEANDLFEKLTRSGGFSSASELYETITETMKEKYPSRFKNPNRSDASAVERTEAPQKKGGKSFADLPADAKKACELFIRDIPGYTKEKYLSTYEWD